VVRVRGGSQIAAFFVISAETIFMKQLPISIAALFTSCLVALAANAGTEVTAEKEMKEIAPLPPPPLCQWGGFYAGLHGGGQFGHSETGYTVTATGLGTQVAPTFGYRESGFIGGGQFGYNFQWRRLVLGPEFDIGYMNMEGSGSPFGFSAVHGATDSDFYTTLRGRIGAALDWHGCWLLYATGGAIGVNYTTRFHLDPDFFDGRDNNFDWGYCVGGGVERQINRRWSIKLEYLYFSLDRQSFDNSRSFFTGDQPVNLTADVNGETFGHILRAGLNFHF
jgi:outer membrane immunogenic protein